MAQLTKLNIQNFGEFGDTEIEFNKITLISNEFPITLIRNMLLSFFYNATPINKTELQKYLIKDKPLIISLPFTFSKKGNLTLKYEYNNVELSSFIIVDEEKNVIELTNKHILIDFPSLQQYLDNYTPNNEIYKYEDTERNNYSITFSMISNLRKRKKNKSEESAFDNRIYDELKTSIRQIKQLLDSIETISEQKMVDDTGLIGLNSNVLLIEVSDDEVYKQPKPNYIYTNREIIDRMGDYIAKLSQKYRKKTFIVHSDIGIINLLEDRLIKYNIPRESINIHRVIEKSFSLNSYFDEEQKKLKKEIEERDNKLTISNQTIKNLNNEISTFKDQLSIVTDKMLLKNLKLPSDSISNKKISEQTIKYLKSAEYLMKNLSNGHDYSPVVLQYGRAVESELSIYFTKEMKSTFENFINNDIDILTGNFLFLKDEKNGFKVKPFSFFQMQYCLAIWKSKMANSKSFFDNLEKNILKNYFDLEKLQEIDFSTLDYIRKKRNDAGHAGKTLSEGQAKEMKKQVFAFLNLWISAKK